MKRITILLVATILFIGCQKEETLNEKSVLLKENNQPDSLDKWISANYTKPYGIAVYYQSNAVSPYTNVYPPKAEKVLPVLKVLKTLWIDIYNDSKIGGANFIREAHPINLNLYGGKNTGSGLEEIGTPGSALTMHIYNVDAFKEKDSASLFQLLRITHHNYAKKLIEQKPFDKEAWKKITLHQFYEGWQKDYGKIYTPFYSPAYFFGFYSILARKSIEDDFLETVSVVLTHTKKDIEEVIDYSKHNLGPGIPYFDFLAQHAHVSMSNKKAFIAKYFKENWQINLQRLQNLSIAKTNNYLKK